MAVVVLVALTAWAAVLAVVIAWPGQLVLTLASLSVLVVAYRLCCIVAGRR